MRPRLLLASFALFALVLACLSACSPAESVTAEPAAESRQTLGSSVFRVVPLAWHSDDAWIVDAPDATVVRRAPCGEPEPDISVWTQDIDAASLPHGARLLAATLSIAPCDAARSWLPDNPPVAAVNLVDSFGQITHVASAQDTSPSVADYAIPHRIWIGAAALPVIDRSAHRVVLRLENEYGADALAGMRILGLRIQYETP